MGKELDNIPCAPGSSELHRVPHDRTGHAVPAATAASRFGADDGDDLDEDDTVADGHDVAALERGLPPVEFGVAPPDDGATRIGRVYGAREDVRGRVARGVGRPVSLAASAYVRQAACPHGGPPCGHVMDYRE